MTGLKTEYFDELTVFISDYALEDRLTSGIILTELPQEGLHKHDFFEGYYLFEGRSSLLVQGATVTMGPGEFLLLGPSAWHRLTELEEASYLMQLRMRREYVASNFEVLPLIRPMNEKAPCSPNLLKGNMAQFASFQRIIRGLAKEIESEGPAEKEILSAWINLAIATLQRCSELDPQCLQSAYLPTPTDTSLRVSEIISYINENHSTITRKELAQRFGYDENYMSHLIYRATGYRFTQLRQQIRLEHARRLISLAEYSIEGAAHKVGFKNMSHFYSIFEQTFGCSPSDCKFKG